MLKLKINIFFLILTGCSTIPEVQDTNLDVGFFECNIQPIMNRGCAFNSCHGNAARPLAIYSPAKMRSLGDELIGEFLTDYELCSNFYRTIAFTQATPSQLITKPATLSGEASQYHAGNYLFSSDDQEAQCLKLWMEGEKHPAGLELFPDEHCRMKWRTYNQGKVKSCTPRQIDCRQVIKEPDVFNEEFTP